MIGGHVATLEAWIVRQRSLVVFSLLVGTAFLLPAVGSSSIGPDAGSGEDAPDHRSDAWSLAYGSYEAVLADEDDDDWYRTEEASSAARCVSTSVTADAPLVETLRLATGAGTTTVPVSIAASVPTVTGVAVLYLKGSYEGFGKSNDLPTAYNWTTASMALPTSGGWSDGFSAQDAGATVATALPVTSGCLGGRLGSVLGLVDQVDVYSFQLDAGDTVYYSLATFDPVRISLLDAAGHETGLSILPGETAAYYAQDAGTYYLSAQRTSSTVDSSYLVGITAGPDPGNGCRPYCLISQ
jgi:hypothetical protein